MLRRALLATALGALPALLVLSPLALAEPDLLARWPVDEITASQNGPVTPDSSGNGHEGRNAAGSLVAGRFGQALSTPALNDGFDAIVSLSLEPQRLTVMAWARKGGPYNVYRQIVNKGGKWCGGAPSSWLLDTGPDGSLRWSVDLISGEGEDPVTTPSGVVAPSAVWDDQWHAVAGTFDGRTIALWLDGVKIATAVTRLTQDPHIVYTRGGGVAEGVSASHYSQQHDYEQHIDCDQNGFQFRGAVDDVRMYGRALTDAEIRYLQRAGTTSPPELPVPADQAEPPGTTPTAEPENLTRPAIREVSKNAATCDPGTWSNLPSPPNFTYKWIAVQPGRSVTVATTADYSPSPANYGASHYCEVSARGPQTTAAATSDRVFFSSAGMNTLPQAYGDVRIRGIDVFQIVQPTAKASMYGFPNAGPFSVACGGGTPTNYKRSVTTVSGFLNGLAICTLAGRDPQRADYEGVTLDRYKPTTAVVYVDVPGDRAVKDRTPFQVLLGAARTDGISVGDPLVVTVHRPQGSSTPYVTRDERDDPRHGVQFRLPSSWYSAGGSIRLTARILFPNGDFGGEVYGTRQCDVTNCSANDDFTLSKVPFVDFPELLVKPIQLRRIRGGQGRLNDPSNVIDAARRLLPGGSRWTIAPYGADLDITDASNLTTCAPSPGVTVSVRGCRMAAIGSLVDRWITDNPARSIRTSSGSYRADVYDVVMAVHNYSADGTNTEPGWQKGGTNVNGVSNFEPAHTPDTSFFTVTDTIRPLTSAAHEMGHFLGSPHAGRLAHCHNPDPTEAWSPDDAGRLQGVAFNASTPRASSVGLTASQVDPYVDPEFDPGNPTDIKGRYDIESYCSGADKSLDTPGFSWISPRNWNRYTYALQQLGSRVGYGDRPRITAPPGVAKAAAANTGPGFAVGTAGTADGHIDRVVPPDGNDAIPAPVPSSPYRLRSLGAGGKVLLEAGVAVRASSEAPDVGDFVGPVADGAVAVELLRDGAVLHRLERSRAPAVKLRGPKARTRLARGRALRVTWQASDPDGDPLEATVDFSPDGGRSWRTLFQGPSSGQATIAAKMLPGSRRARVRVAVNDGFSERSALSGTFVTPGFPPQVQILSPSAGGVALATGRTTLIGTATDDLRRTLTRRSLTWFAGRRRLGTGARLRVRLPAGLQTLRLVARDSNGKLGAAGARLRVLPSQLRVVSVQVPVKVRRGAGKMTVRVRTSAPATLTVAGRRLRVGTRLTRLTIPLPGRPAVGLVRVPFRLTSRSRSVTGTIRGAVSVVRT